MSIVQATENAVSCAAHLTTLSELTQEELLAIGGLLEEGFVPLERICPLIRDTETKRSPQLSFFGSISCSLYLLNVDSSLEYSDQ